MKPYQQRVVDEKQELDIKIKGLDRFVYFSNAYAGLTAEEQDQLCRQLDHMVSYSKVLGERIAAFN